MALRSTLALLLLGVTALGQLITPKAGCNTSLDCSLNGDCVEAVCHCDAPWSGSACETIRFKPVKKLQGYGMQPNRTTWGGNAIFDGEKYHLYASAMSHGCPLSTWHTASRIDYATAPEITGPYEFQSVAVPTWGHNPAPLALADGTYAIFHIGSGDGPEDVGTNCTGPIPTGHLPCFIHVSESLEGPWSLLPNNTLPVCNNPAPWIHSNGTIFIVCYSVLHRADHISGPWTTVSSRIKTMHGEDPFLYADKRGFHILTHHYTEADRDECVDAVTSGHTFSEDGHTWYGSDVQPYTTQIEIEDGETITVSTRERPKLFFDANGQMTHLFTGVCATTKCPSEGPCAYCKLWYWDYTLVQPLDLSPPTPSPWAPALSPPALAV